MTGSKIALSIRQIGDRQIGYCQVADVICSEVAAVLEARRARRLFAMRFDASGRPGSARGPGGLRGSSRARSRSGRRSERTFPSETIGLLLADSAFDANAFGAVGRGATILRRRQLRSEATARLVHLWDAAHYPSNPVPYELSITQRHFPSE